MKKALLNGSFHDCELIERKQWQKAYQTHDRIIPAVAGWLIELANGERIVVPEQVIFDR